MRHHKAIHLNLVDEKQFKELTQLADADVVDTSDQVTIVQRIATETSEPQQTDKLLIRENNGTA